MSLLSSSSLLLLACQVQSATAFATPSLVSRKIPIATTTSLDMMMDTSMVASQLLVDGSSATAAAGADATTMWQQATSSTISTFNFDASSNLWLSFTDQGQNLAGIFFQASLLPYLLFLYWLSFRANRIPALGNFGFQFVLLFVISTIPSGILSRSVYGTSLANVDWLHGGAETLLTVANVLIVS